MDPGVKTHQTDPYLPYRSRRKTRVTELIILFSLKVSGDFSTKINKKSSISVKNNNKYFKACFNDPMGAFFKLARIHWRKTRFNKLKSKGMKTHVGTLSKTLKASLISSSLKKRIYKIINFKILGTGTIQELTFQSKKKGRLLNSFFGTSKIKFFTPLRQVNYRPAK